MSDKVGIFIDGAYLDKILQDEFNLAKLDYQKLSQWLSQGTTLLRTHYYHCLPYQSDPPTTVEKERFSKRQAFYGRLAQLPRFDVKLGKLENRGARADGTPLFIQKRVDILLGVDLVLLAAKQRITHATILAGDSDFLPAITIAKNEGVIITLCHGTIHPPHDDLWSNADDRVTITPDIINTLLR